MAQTIESTNVIYKMPDDEVIKVKTEKLKIIEENKKASEKNQGYGGMMISGTVTMFSAISSDSGMVSSGVVVLGHSYMEKMNPIIQTNDVRMTNDDKLMAFEENIHLDGQKTFKMHGAFFNAPDFDRYFIRKGFTARDVFFLWNNEQRSAILREHGYGIFFNDDKAKLLDKMKDISVITNKPVTYRLYDVKMRLRDLQSSTVVAVRLVKVEDHSTHKTVFLCVPRNDETRTCRGAIAWTFGMRENEYQPEYET